MYFEYKSLANLLFTDLFPLPCSWIQNRLISFRYCLPENLSFRSRGLSATILLGGDSEHPHLVYMLISVCGREILTELFPTIQDAQRAMHQEMEEWGGVDSSVFTATELDGGDFGFGP